MSWIKNFQGLVEERGYEDSDKYVCAGCVGNTYIAKRIRDSHVSGVCSFCGSRRNILPMNDVLEIIARVVKRDYLPALDNAIWDSEEKRYLDDVADPYDFVHDVLNSYLEIDSDDLLNEIMDKLAFEDRISIYQFVSRQEERDMEQWEAYCDLVNSCSLSAEQIVGLIADGKNVDLPLTDALKAIRKTLKMVYDYCRDMRLFSVLYGLSSQFKAAAIYRCVNYLDYNQSVDGLKFIPATLIGTAPPKKIEDNRMSERGDMMFYGAEDERTAMAEVGSKGTNPATIGLFYPNKRFRVLDLTDMAQWKRPSIFDVDRQDVRSTWSFLKEFQERVSEEKNSGNTYKPTQVFTKYIQRNTDLQGIKYNSSKHPGGKCYVLFVSTQDCLDNGDKTNPARSQLVMETLVQKAFEKK